jgi:hypothetical protein
MKTVHLSKGGLIIMLFLAVWNVGQAQDSLGMGCVSGLDYWQQVDDIQMVGDTAYIASGASGVHIMDLSNPSNPVEIGRCTWYECDDVLGGVYITGNLAYAGTGCGGFVFDISNPRQPVQLSHWYEVSMEDIFVHGQYGVGETDQGYPYVLDVSNLSNIHTIGGFPGLLTLTEPFGMAGEYLCMNGSGLTIWDMSIPSQPVQMAAVDTQYRVISAAKVGDYAYLSCFHNGGIRVIDISNPLQPTEVAACDTGYRGEVIVSGNHLVVGKGLALDIWNISDPINPILEGCLLREQGQSDFGKLAGTENTVCAGNWLGSAHLRGDMAATVIDISNPAIPEEVASFGNLGFLHNGTYNEELAIIADGLVGFHIIDLTNPQDVAELSHLQGIDFDDVAMQGHYVYGVGSNEGLLTYDITEPAHPESLSCWNVGIFHPCKITIIGDYAYVFGYNPEACLFSLLNPEAPVLVDSILEVDSPILAVSDGLLYVARVMSVSTIRFTVYNVANPASPQVVGVCQFPTHAFYDYISDITVAGDYAFLAAPQSGMYTIDISNPSSPYQAAWVGMPCRVLISSGNVLFRAEESRISMLDLSENPLNPTCVGYYATDEVLYDMHIVNEYLLTVSSSQFRVYQCDGLSVTPSQPEIVPYEFALYPCYPNPFNSSTVLRFSLPQTEHTKLVIYDITGREVRILVDEVVDAGVHQVFFDGLTLSSGVYFAQLKIGHNVKMEKLVLLK